MNFQSLIREGIFGHDQFRCAILVCTEISIFCKYIPIINWWHHSDFLSSKLKIKTKNWQFNVIIVVMMIHLKNSTKKLFNFIILGKLHLKKVFLFEISYLLTKSVLVFGEESYHSIHEVYFLKIIHYGISSSRGSHKGTKKH